MNMKSDSNWDRMYKIWINILALSWLVFAGISVALIVSQSFKLGIFFAVLTFVNVIAVFVLAGVDTYRRGGKNALLDFTIDMLERLNRRSDNK